MQIWELFDTDNVVTNTKNAVLDIVSALRAQNIDRVMVDRVIQMISKNPDLSGIRITPELIGNAVEGIKDIKMEPDADRPKNPLTLFISPSSSINNGGKQVNNKEQVSKAADKQLQREL